MGGNERQKEVGQGERKGGKETERESIISMYNDDIIKLLTYHNHTGRSPSGTPTTSLTSRSPMTHL